MGAARNPDTGLTELRERFVNELIRDPSSHLAAYIRAGGSEKNASKNAHRMTNDPVVIDALARAREGRALRVQITNDKVLAEINDQLSVDLSDVMTWSGEGSTLTDSKDLTKVQRKAIKRLRIKTTTRTEAATGDTLKDVTVEVELHDRLRLIELAGRHLGMWEGDGGSMVKNTQVNIFTNMTPGEIRERKAALRERYLALKAVSADRVT